MNYNEALSKYGSDEEFDEEKFDLAEFDRKAARREKQYNTSSLDRKRKKAFKREYAK